MAGAQAPASVALEIVGNEIGLGRLPIVYFSCMQVKASLANSCHMGAMSVGTEAGEIRVCLFYSFSIGRVRACLAQSSAELAATIAESHLCPPDQFPSVYAQRPETYQCVTDLFKFPRSRPTM